MQLPQERLQALFPTALCTALRRVGRKGSKQPFRLCQCFERRDQIMGHHAIVRGAQQQAINLVLDQLAYGPHIGGDRHTAKTLCLDDRERRTFPSGRQHEGIGPGQQSAEPATVIDRRIDPDTEFGKPLLPGTACPCVHDVGTDNAPVDVDTLALQGTSRSKDPLDAFLPVQPSQEHSPQAAIAVLLTVVRQPFGFFRRHWVTGGIRNMKQLGNRHAHAVQPLRHVPRAGQHTVVDVLIGKRQIGMARRTAEFGTVQHMHVVDDLDPAPAKFAENGIGRGKLVVDHHIKAGKEPENLFGPRVFVMPHQQLVAGEHVGTTPQRIVVGQKVDGVEHPVVVGDVVVDRLSEHIEVDFAPGFFRTRAAA